MSKAFTRESDDSPEPILRRLASALPPGAKNYLTPDGAERLRAELDRLTNVERPQLASQSVDRERLQVLDQRILYLSESLQTSVIVPPPKEDDKQVRFGATVTVRAGDGEESRYRLVGVDETDIDRGWISWLSPIAKALINRRVGDRVRLQFPSGATELEIIGVTYG